MWGRSRSAFSAARRIISAGHAPAEAAGDVALVAWLAGEDVRVADDALELFEEVGVHGERTLPELVSSCQTM